MKQGTEQQIEFFPYTQQSSAAKALTVESFKRKPEYAPGRFSQIALVNIDDPRYRKLVGEERSRIPDRRLSHACTPDDALTLQDLRSRAAESAEKIIRDWLSQQITCTENRVLLHSKFIPHAQYHSKQYVELDAVIGTAEKPLVFVEIKVSSNSEWVGLGIQQIRKRIGIAAHRWREVRPTLIVVDLSPEGMIASRRNDVFRVYLDSHQQLNMKEYMHALRGDRVPCIKITPAEFFAIADRSAIPLPSRYRESLLPRAAKGTYVQQLLLR